MATTAVDFDHAWAVGLANGERGVKTTVEDDVPVKICDADSEWASMTARCFLTEAKLWLLRTGV